VTPSPLPTRTVHDHAPPSILEQLGEVVDLTGGFAVALLPLMLTAVPGLALFFVFPAMALALVAAIPVVVLGVLLAPPVLVARMVLRRRRAAA
jgi:hypothetical protein